MFSRKIRRLVAGVAAILVSSLLCRPAEAGFTSDGSILKPTPGTVAIDTTITWQGKDREVLYIRPDPQNTKPAPAILMLHYEGGTPDLMANLTKAGELAASQGYWVILPHAALHHWHDNPSDLGDNNDDVGFLAQVVQTATSQFPIDASRVSISGFSNGGFMAERMICEKPELFASAIIDAAIMRTPLANSCQPTQPVPVMYVNGTADPLVSYNGIESMLGAPTSVNLWSGFHSCNQMTMTTTDLPVIVNDGTTITLQTLVNCRSLGNVLLYTVNGGGHAWPGGNPLSGHMGIVSQNLDLTTVLGQFAKNWTNTSTHPLLDVVPVGRRPTRN